VWRLYKPYWKQLLVIMVGALFTSALTGTSQVTLTPLLDVVLSGGKVTLNLEGPLPPPTLDLNEIGSFLLSIIARVTGLTDAFQLLLVTSVFYLVLAVAVRFGGFALGYYQSLTTQLVSRDTSTKLFGHVIRLPMSYINKHPSGWLQSRIFNDVRSATSDLLNMTSNGLSTSFVSIFYAFLLISTDVRLTIVAATAGIMHVVVTRLLTNRIKELTTHEFGMKAFVSGILQERLSTVREIKSLAAEKLEEDTYFKNYESMRRIGLKNSALRQLEKPMRWTINRTVIIVVMLYGSWLLINGQLTIAGFGLFMFFAQSLIGPLSALAGITIQFASVEASLDEVFRIVDHPVESGGSKEPPSDGVSDRIEFRDVSFAYGNESVLKNINITILSGEMVALVGQSGAGKSTIADMLLRFFDPDEGQILLDGVPITDFDLQSYRRLFGIVSQDATILDDTVYNNIAYARPWLSKEQVEEAVRIANAERFILNDLPEGYDTILGERGVRLSGGQRQRIAIGRAVAHQPPILILDEATSSLDTESERLVQLAIDDVVKDCTALVIAHRLSTIRRANKIIAIHEGKIIEEGTHDELLARQGYYYVLHQQQFADEDITIDTELMKAD